MLQLHCDCSISDDETLRAGGTILMHPEANWKVIALSGKEETRNAVTALWESGKLFAGQLWRFACVDGDGKYLPRPLQANAKIL